MDLFVNSKQGKNASRNDAANRKAGSTGSRAQEKPVRSYDELVKIVQEFRGGKNNSVACAFHPQASGQFVEARKGWIRIYQGEAGYQLNSGEFVKV